MAVCESGYHLHLRKLRRERHDPARYETSDERFILQAALGLLALLVAFTFSVALDRYQTRRDLVVAEANAIGTVWLRAALLDEPGRTALMRAVATHLDHRIVPDGSAAAQRARNALWPTMAAATATIRATPQALGVVEAVNGALDAASLRDFASVAGVPTRVVETLVIFALIEAGILGYVLGGTRSRHRAATTILFALVSLAIVVILDLDRPRSGAIIVSLAPLTQLQAGFAAGLSRL